VKLSSADAFEIHLQALTRSLDLQAELVRSAFDLHPDFPLGDFRGLTAEAIGKFRAAVGDLRSDLIAVAATARVATESPVAMGSPTRKRASSKGSRGSRRSSDRPSWKASSIQSAEEEEVGQPASRGSSTKLSDVALTPFVLSDVDAHKTRGAPTTTSDATAMSKGPRRTPRCIDGVLNPDWPPRLSWDMVVVFLVLCDSVVIPFQLAEFNTGPRFDEFWLWLTIAIFGSDLVMNFFTGYRAGKNDKPRQEGTLVTEKACIAVNYLRGWFWIDFMSTVPWHIIAEAFTSSSETSSGAQVTKLAKVVKLTRLLRLMRMLRLAKIQVIWDRLEGKIGSITALNVVSMCKVLLIWAAICHWGACIWWMVGRRDSLVMLITFQEDPDALHWTELPRRHSPEDSYGTWRWVDRPVAEQYVFCFYWILGVMRTMPAEVTPITLVERMFVLLFMFFAVMAFAVNVARITQAWFKFSARKDAFKEEMAYVRMHLRSINCGATLQLRTQGYLNHLYAKRKLHAKEAGLLGVLPDELKLQLVQAQRIRFLKMISRLQGWKDPDLRRVCDATDAIDYLPGDAVVERNSDADAAHVLMRGGLQVLAAEDQRATASGTSPRSRASRRSSLVQRLSVRGGVDPLTVVDEHCLFDLGSDVKSRNTVVALECSEVLRIDRRRFQDVLQTRSARKAADAHARSVRDTLGAGQQAASDSEGGSDDEPPSEDLGGVRGAATGMAAMRQSSEAFRQQQMQHNAASAAVSAG